MYISGYLTSWPQMTFDLDLRPLTTWTYEGFQILSINNVWFKLDFNFLNEAIFTFLAYLKTWPQMTFDIGTWPLTAWTYGGSYILSNNQVWFKSDLNFSNEAIFTLSYNLNSFDLWHWYMTFDRINKFGFLFCIYDPTLIEMHQSMWRIELKVKAYFTTDNRQQQIVDKVIHVSFLPRQATQKWNCFNLAVITQCTSTLCILENLKSHQKYNNSAK